MKDFIQRLSSRKFLAFCAGILAVIVHPELWQPIVALVGGYLGVEGGRDVVYAYAAEKTKQAVVDARSTLLVNEVPPAATGDLTDPHPAPPQNPVTGAYVPGQ